MTNIFSFTKDLILYEDNHVLIVDKPHRAPVTADDSQDTSLEDEAKKFIKIRDSKPGNVYLSLCHRIDRPVRGCVLFAKTSKAASRLSEQIREQKIKKTYYTFVEFDAKPDQATLTDFLKKDQKTNISKVVSEKDSDGKKCILTYQKIREENSRKKNIALLNINLVTGRSHQIRVQLSSRGMFILGDKKYGSTLEFKQGAIALFAYSLEFEHPTTKQIIFVKLNKVPSISPDEKI